MDREANITKAIDKIERDLIEFKSAQPVQKSSVIQYRYAGTFSSNGLTYQRLVFTQNNPAYRAVVAFWIDLPSVKVLSFVEPITTTGVWEVDVGRLPGTDVAYTIISTVKGAVTKVF